MVPKIQEKYAHNIRRCLSKFVWYQMVFIGCYTLNHSLIAQRQHNCCACQMQMSVPYNAGKLSPFYSFSTRVTALRFSHKVTRSLYVLVRTSVQSPTVFIIADDTL